MVSMSRRVHGGFFWKIAGVAVCCGAVFMAWRLGFLAPHCQIRARAEAVDIQAMMLEAAKAQENGRLPEAIGVYERILQADPASAVTHLKLGAIYFHLGLPTKAEDCYLKAVANGVSDPDVYLHLGYIKESQEKLESALEYYARADLAGSRNPILYFNMGNVCARLGRTDAALTHLKRAVLLNPDYMDAFVNLSIVAVQAQEYEDAQYYLEKAERLGYHAPVPYKEGLAAKTQRLRH